MTDSHMWLIVISINLSQVDSSSREAKAKMCGAVLAVDGPQGIESVLSRMGKDKFGCGRTTPVVLVGQLTISTLRSTELVLYCITFT